MARSTKSAPERAPVPDGTDAPIETTADAGARELAARLSAELGENIRPIDPAWRRYAQQGLIVETHVKRERFKLGMTLDDLGIKFDDEKTAEAVAAVLAPGHTFLIPKDATRRIERLDELARENLSRRGFRTFWGSWVHLQNFMRWKEGEPVVEGAERRDRDKGQDELVAEFDREVESLVERYDDLCAQAAKAWYSLAASNWDRLKTTAVATKDPKFWDRDAWIARQVRALADRRTVKLPTKEAIRAKFRIWHDSWLIPTQEQIQVDLIRAGDRRLEAAEAAMLADLQESARREVRGGVDQLMGEVRAQLNGQVFEAVAAALKVVKGRKGRIGRNSSLALREMLASVEELMFWDEGGQFRADLGELRRILDAPTKKRDASELTAVLTALGAQARRTLMDLDVDRERMGVDDDGEPRLSEQVLSKKARALAVELEFDADADRLDALVRREAVLVASDDWDDDDEPDEAPVAARRSAGAPVFDEDEDEAPVLVGAGRRAPDAP